MKRIFLLFITLTLIPTLSQGQGLKFFGGVSFTAQEEFGFPSSINNVEVILIRNDNFRGDDFEPNFGITAGFSYSLNHRLHLVHSLEYTRVLSTFATLDNDQTDPILGSIVQVSTFKQPYLNQQIHLAYELFSFRKIKFSLIGGLVNQILVKNRDNYIQISGRRQEDRRAFEMLNQAPKSFKSIQLRYLYGLGIGFKRFNFDFSHQRYFNRSFTSEIQFENSKTGLKTSRRFFRFSVSYDIFNKKISQ
jgi:hypothetical protein